MLFNIVMIMLRKHRHENVYHNLPLGDVIQRRKEHLRNIIIMKMFLP